MNSSYSSEEIPCSLVRFRTNWDREIRQVKTKKKKKSNLLKILLLKTKINYSLKTDNINLSSGQWIKRKNYVQNVREDHLSPTPCWGSFIKVTSWPSFFSPLTSPPEEEMWIFWLENFRAGTGQRWLSTFLPLPLFGSHPAHRKHALPFCKVERDALLWGDLISPRAVIDSNWN